MERQILEHLDKKIKLRREEYADALASGTATDYAIYKELCGVIRGLAIAQQEIEDLMRRYKEDDDE